MNDQTAAPAAELTTSGGVRLTVRPVRPGDEALLADLFGHVSQEDLRFRFLTALKKVDEDSLQRMTRVDHDRTEDFLAFAEDGTLVAAAMLAGDEARERAEVAISVRQGWKGRGIGWAMLDYAAREAKARGFKTIESIEDRANRPAIQLEREMGFEAEALPGDPTLLLVSKKLVD